MAVNYVSRRCSSCGNTTKFEYIKEEKMWKCLYCDTMMERQEQADSMFTIKNVVRQVLLDLAYGRMENAKDNLVECEKIDSRYVGTLIAKIAYDTYALSDVNTPAGARQNLFSQVEKNYKSLLALGEGPTEEEMVLYEFLDSAEAVGLLLMVYDTLRITKRKEAIAPFFDASQVYSMQLNTTLIRNCFKHQEYETLDKMIQNTGNINCKEVLQLVLTSYPDGSKKQEHIRLLSEVQGALTPEDQRMVESYLESSQDSIQTKCLAACVFCATPARPSVACVMQRVVAFVEQEQEITELFEAVMQKQLLDVEIYTILDYAMEKCSNAVCLYILNIFIKTKHFVELSYQSFMKLLERQGTAAEKQQLVQTATTFHITEKTKQLAIGSYLCDVQDPSETREMLLPYLFSLVESLATNSVEKYLLSCTIDGQNKSKVVKAIFERNINRSFFMDTLNKYVKQSVDSFKVKKEVIYVLASVGIGISGEALLSLLVQKELTVEERLDLFHSLKNNTVNLNELANNYLACIQAVDFQSHIFDELFTGVTNITAPSLIRYVFEIQEQESVKVGRVSQMISLCYESVCSMQCRVMHNGNTIVCNVLQGYILCANEGIEAASVIASVMRNQCRDVNTEVQVGNSEMKFKKYIHSQKNNLTEKTKRLCEESKLL